MQLQGKFGSPSHGKFEVPSLEVSCLIKKGATAKHKGQFTGAAQLYHDILWDKEETLRHEEDHRIKTMKDSTAKKAAEATERLRRQEWDNAHAFTKTVHSKSAITESQVQPDTIGLQHGRSGGGASQLQLTAQQSSSGTNQILTHLAASPGNSNTTPVSSLRHDLRNYASRLSHSIIEKVCQIAGIDKVQQSTDSKHHGE